MKEVILDTETTGLSVRDGHRIVEIGCVELDNLLPTKNIFHCYLNPERKVSEKAFEVHGYTDEFLSTQKKFSDIVGESKYNISNKANINYNFAIDQGYKHFNYNEIGADFTFDQAKFNFSYLEEKNHIGKQEYVQTGIDFKINNSSELSFGTKRNILTRSAEFYNLSYNYINDCLKAGIAYRREFYNDRDIEPTNTLMFTISIVPFATINSPSFAK